MKRILIADDEKIERRGIISLLERGNYGLEIAEACNGREALEIMKRQKPDILLSDIKMPFMNGLELIEKAREIDPDMAIIIFSGYSDFEYARQAIESGVLSYVLKPVDPSQFHVTMQKAVDYVNERAQSEVLLQKNQDFLGQYFLQKFIRTGKLDALEDAEEIVDISWWKDVRRMVLLEVSTDFFEDFTGDFETLLSEELKVSFHYLNLDIRSSLLLFDGRTKVDFRILCEHIHNYMKESLNAECYAAVSSPLEDGMQMPEGLHEVELLMDNRFYRPEERVFMPDTSLDGKDNYDRVVKLLEMMEEDVRLRDITHLWEHFRKFAAQKQNGASFSHIFVKFSCSNIVKEMYRDMNFSSEKCASAVEKLYQSSTIQEIIDILEANIRCYEDTMFSNQTSARSDVEKVKSYIYEHYAEELSVEILGGGVYLSPGYMSYIFKKETGEGLTHFIRAYRLEKAKNLLRGTNKKIVQICKETGFTNASYFCKSFREYYGCSPERFRKGVNANEDFEDNHSEIS